MRYIQNFRDVPPCRELPAKRKEREREREHGGERLHPHPLPAVLIFSLQITFHIKGNSE